MHYKRIISDPKIMLGKPVIKGTRITVELILRKLSEGAKISDILIMYNHIKEEDVLAALTYASDVVSKEEMLSITK